MEMVVRRPPDLPNHQSGDPAGGDPDRSTLSSTSTEAASTTTKGIVADDRPQRSRISDGLSDASGQRMPRAVSASSNACHSSSVNRRERVRKRYPSGPSSENMPPRPGTTSIISWVCFQYSNWEAPI